MSLITLYTAIVLLIIVFLIAAIKVFNPVFHPDLIVTSGEGTSLVEQIRYGAEGTVFGSILLIVIAGIVVIRIIVTITLDSTR